MTDEERKAWEVEQSWKVYNMTPGQRANYEKMQILNSLLEQQDNRCFYCGDEMTERSIPRNPKERTIDHVMPLDLGGSDEVTNLVAACLECNNRKDNMHPEDYKKMIEEEKMTQEHPQPLYDELRRLTAELDSVGAPFDDEDSDMSLDATAEVPSPETQAVLDKLIDIQWRIQEVKVAIEIMAGDPQITTCIQAKMLAKEKVSKHRDIHDAEHAQFKAHLQAMTQHLGNIAAHTRAVEETPRPTLWQHLRHQFPFMGFQFCITYVIAAGVFSLFSPSIALGSFNSVVGTGLAVGQFLVEVFNYWKKNRKRSVDEDQ